MLGITLSVKDLLLTSNCPGLPFEITSLELVFLILGLAGLSIGGVEHELPLALLPKLEIGVLLLLELEPIDNKLVADCSLLLMEPFFKFFAKSEVLLLLFCLDNSFNWLILCIHLLMVCINNLGFKGFDT